MSTRRYKISRRNKKFIKNKTNKTGKKWITAIAAANKTLQKTGSFSAAKASLKKQALYNARKLFGSI